MFSLAASAFLAKILLNFTFWLFYVCLIRRDRDLEAWTRYDKNKASSRCIACFGCSLSFKMFRCFFTYFYGHTTFRADFAKPKRF